MIGVITQFKKGHVQKDRGLFIYLSKLLDQCPKRYVVNCASMRAS